MISTDEIIKLGQSLRRINSQILKKNSSNESIWFQGDEKYFDVFLELESDEVVWFQFSLRGKFLEWRKNLHIKSGETNEFHNEISSNSPRSKLLSQDRGLDLKFLELAKSILSYCNDDKLLMEVKKILSAEGL